jgi:hypothetical protein
MKKLLINCRLILFNLILILSIFFPILIFGQGGIEFQVEGKEFKNNETSLIIKFGYISVWNTYGLTFTNKNGSVFYFINCTKNISSDGNSMILAKCRNLNDESGGTVYVYPNKIIQSYPDGRLVFEPINSSDDFSEVQKNISTGKSDDSVIGESIKIGNLIVAQNNFPEPMNIDYAKDACVRLEKGWRLPNIKELNILYQNKPRISGFGNLSYWSSTVTPQPEHPESKRVVHFLYGCQGASYVPPYATLYVRAVRTLLLFDFT